MKNCDTGISTGYETKVYRTMDEIESLRPVWQRMQSRQSRPVINADIDRYISVVESMQNHTEPYVILLKVDGEPVTLVIGRLETTAIRCKLGYKTILKPNMRCLSIVYGGILGRMDEETASVVCDELVDTTRTGLADAVMINHLRKDSVLYGLLRSRVNFWCRGHFPGTETHWTMSVPDDIEDFYAARSKKHRKHLKRYQRKLHEAFPGKVEYETYTSTDEIGKAVNEAAEISRKTYQHSIGSGFDNNVQRHNLLKVAAEKGWLLAYILKLGGRPAAFRFGLKYGNTFFCNGTGYDPAFGKYRIGTLLFLKTLENLCRDTTVETVDFGFGDAGYKQSYGDNSWDEATFYIFAPRLFPVTVNILQGFFAGVSACGVYILQRLNSLSSLKRKWRDRLRSKP